MPCPTLTLFDLIPDGPNSKQRTDESDGTGHQSLMKADPYEDRIQRRRNPALKHNASASYPFIFSNCAHTPSAPCHAPRVAPFEYSVARASKKLACSTPLSISRSQGSGCFSMP